MRAQAPPDALDGFPRLYAAASLKPTAPSDSDRALYGFPRLYAAASLKRLRQGHDPCLPAAGFPRLYAAASLKQHHHDPMLGDRAPGFPRLYAAASLKRRKSNATSLEARGVFRGFMPRPH